MTDLTEQSLEDALVDLDKLRWHKDYVASLKRDGFGMAVPKCEGALYFGDAITVTEYIEKYEDAINRNDKVLFE